MSRRFLVLPAIVVFAMLSGASNGPPQDPSPDLQHQAPPAAKVGGTQPGRDGRPGVPRRFGSGLAATRGGRMGGAQPAHAQLPSQVNRPSSVPGPELSRRVNQNIAAGNGNAGANYNERLRQSLPVQPPAVIHSGTLPSGNTRHQGPNPAVIGGSMHPAAGQTGAINGTGMSKKH